MTTYASVVLYEQDPDVLYSIASAARLANVSRHQVALYCQHGLVSPVMDPDNGGWYFSDEGVRTFRRIEHLRTAGGMNLTAIKMILGLTAEVERLRDELDGLRQLGKRPLQPRN